MKKNAIARSYKGYLYPRHVLFEWVSIQNVMDNEWWIVEWFVLTRNLIKTDFNHFTVQSVKEKGNDKYRTIQRYTICGPLARLFPSLKIPSCMAYLRCQRKRVTLKRQPSQTNVSIVRILTSAKHVLSGNDRTLNVSRTSTASIHIHSKKCIV